MTAREARSTVAASRPGRRQPGDAPIDGQIDEPGNGPGDAADEQRASRPKEIGGPAGPEPTRYGDWERGGRCSDF